MKKFFAVNIIVNYLGEITNQIYTVKTENTSFLNANGDFKKNHIIFAVMQKIGMLDKFREDFISEAFNENPSLLEKFKNIFENIKHYDAEESAEFFSNLLSNNPFLVADFISENINNFTLESYDNSWQLEGFKLKEVDEVFVNTYLKLTNEELHFIF